MALAWVGLVGILLLTVGVTYVLFAPSREGLLAKLRNLIAGGLCLTLGALCVMLTMALRSFEAFANSTVVAEVRCKWVGPREFDLTWQPIREGNPPQSKIVRLRGDQWSISGGVVKWHPWLTALGLPSYHKPTRLSGRYASTAEETASLPTAVALDGEPDPVWWWFYRLDRFLPFIEATYGSAAFTYVNPALVFEVLVTPSGYLIKGKRPKPSRASGAPLGRPPRQPR